jgi:hypothetical protein
MGYDEGIDDEIDLLGEDVTIRVPAVHSYNDRGDVNESGSPTDIETIAIPNILGNDDLEVREGKFQNGDKRFFFKSDATNITNRNRIYHDSLWYEIEEVLKHRLQNQIAGYEVLARKV